MAPTAARRRLQIGAARGAGLLVAQLPLRHAMDHQETVLVGVYESSRALEPARLPPGDPDGLSRPREGGAGDRRHACPKAARRSAAPSSRPSGTGPHGNEPAPPVRPTTRWREHERRRAGEVMAALTGRPSASSRVAFYFLAFDIEADRFQSVRDVGALVMAAANRRSLTPRSTRCSAGKIPGRAATIRKFLHFPHSYYAYFSTSVDGRRLTHIFWNYAHVFGVADASRQLEPAKSDLVQGTDKVSGSAVRFSLTLRVSGVSPTSGSPQSRGDIESCLVFLKETPCLRGSVANFQHSKPVVHFCHGQIDRIRNSQYAIGNRQFADWHCHWRSNLKLTASAR